MSGKFVLLYESFVLVIGKIFWCLLKRSCLEHISRFYKETKYKGTNWFWNLNQTYMGNNFWRNVYFFLSAIIHNKNMKTILK